MKLNVYEFQVSGEKEWICARTMVEAFQLYHAMVNVSELDPEDEVIIVPESKWPDIEFVDQDEIGEDDCHITFTLSEFMEGEVKAQYIGSTTEP